MSELANSVLTVGVINAHNAGYHQAKIVDVIETASLSDICVVPEILPASDYVEPGATVADFQTLQDRSRELGLQAVLHRTKLRTRNYDDTQPRSDRRQLGLTISRDIASHVDDVSSVRFGGRYGWQVTLNPSLLGAKVMFAGVHAPDRPAEDRAACIKDLVDFSEEYERVIIAGDLNESAKRTPQSRALEIAGRVARVIPPTEPDRLEGNKMTLGRMSHLLRKGGEIARGTGHDRLVAAGLTPANLGRPTMKLLGLIPMTPDGVYTKGLVQSSPQVTPVYYSDHATVTVDISLR